MRVRYANVMKLFSQLKIARADGSYAKEMRTLLRCDLLILDDFGLKPLDADSRLSLLEMLEDRFKIHSTILVSQIPSAKWFECIGDATIADAIFDRHDDGVFGGIVDHRLVEWCTRPHVPH